MTDAEAEPPALTRAVARANARAAARAAARATVPVPEMPLQPLVTMAVVGLAGLLTISAFADPVLVAVTVALAGGIIAWGWSGLLGLPSPRGTAFVLAVGSAAAIGTALATRDDPLLQWLPAALAGSMIVAFLHSSPAGTAVRASWSPSPPTSPRSRSWSPAPVVVLPRAHQGPWVVALASSAVAMAAVTDLVGVAPRTRAWLLPLGMLAGGGAAIAVGHLSGAVGWGAAASWGCWWPR